MPRARCCSDARGGVLTKLLLGIVVTGAVVLAVWGIAGAGPSQPVPAAAASADQAAASVQSFDITTTASGELQAKNQIEIRSKLESESSIVEIVDEGSRVKAGDVLVKLKTDKLKEQIDEATLQVESARAEMIAAENSYKIQVNENDFNFRQAQLAVELAELSYRKWLEGDVATKRQTNQRELSKSQLELDRMAEKLVQSQELLAKGFLSKDQYDQDSIAYINAQSAWITARLSDDVFENYEYPQELKTKLAEIDKARSQVEKVKLNNEIEMANKESARTNRQRVLNLREQGLAKFKEQFEAATIKAPADGLVVYGTTMNSGRYWGGGEGPLAIGRQVYPNELLIVLPDTSEMIAAVRVHESLAGKIAKGQTAHLKIDAVGGKSFAGKVESIGVLAESNSWRDPNLREYTVKVSLDKDESTKDLKPSMRCDAQLLLDRAENALSVPVQAVMSDGPVRFVYVNEKGSWARRPVKLGRRSDTRAEIAAGLDEGSMVLLREPPAGQVGRVAWDKGELEKAGYALDEKGQPMLAAAPKPPKPKPAEPAAEKETASAEATPAPEASAQGASETTAVAPAGS